MSIKLSKDQKIDKIKGALYGFAIGDAMGATTEFMSDVQIKGKYYKLTDIIGGGWINLKAGEVTDDTQMTMCVIKAVMNSNDSDKFVNNCANNFSNWLNSGPKDVGGQCSRAIKFYQRCNELIEEDESALGNGSLMRALPCALINNLNWNMLQNDITHPNATCRRIIKAYHENIVNLINGENYMLNSFKLEIPSGHVENTFNNAIYWANKFSFSECIIGAVNHGGDADTIAAIAGSLSGARFGFKNIPERWIKQLDEEVKKSLNNFVNYIYNCIVL